MQNSSLNPDMMNNIKNLVDNGNISEAISQISPEMIENFSKMLSNNSNTSTQQNSSSDSTSNNYSSNFTNSNNYANNSNNSNTSSKNSYNDSKNSSSGFDFNNIDMNTILKMKSIMEKMNNQNDPRSNLLYSLKPYLRETKQEKLDQYVNLLKVSKIAEVLKNDKKDDKNA